MKIEAELARLGLVLPEAMPHTGHYVPAVRLGAALFLSGHGPQPDPDGRFIGKLGRDLTVEQGCEAAQVTAVNCLGTIKRMVGDLDRVERIIKLLGFINAVDGFRETPRVLNGASDLLTRLYGERGMHARSAIGVSALPHNIAIEVEMIVQIREE
jgi:enamine deaminase RidA (YjgF/YER057c/UK114 family)